MGERDKERQEEKGVEKSKKAGHEKEGQTGMKRNRRGEK